MVGKEAPIWVIDVKPFAPKVVGTTYEIMFSHSGIATEGHEKPVSIIAGNDVYIMSIIASSLRRRKFSKQSPIKTIERIKGVINTIVVSIVLRIGIPKRGITIPRIMSKMTIERPK